LGVHGKACGLLNVEGFYDPLIEQFDRGLAEGFINPVNRAIVIARTDAAALLDALTIAPPLPEASWIGSPQQT
jgi:predicted Rossmann-fold nucleotide-binding protein